MAIKISLEYKCVITLQFGHHILVCGDHKPNKPQPVFAHE